MDGMLFILKGVPADSLVRRIAANDWLLACIVALEPFAWPAAVVVIVLVAMFLFRDALTRLIDRIKGFAWGSRSVDAGSASQPTEALPSPGTAPPELPGDPAVEETVTVVRDLLQLDQVHDSALRERRLLYHAAQTSLSWYFEQVYRTIFGSQIRALKLINQAPVPQVVVRVLHDGTARENPDSYSHYSFEMWFGYMTGINLVVGQGDAVHITHYGRLFLMYMAQQGLDEMKPN